MDDIEEGKVHIQIKGWKDGLQGKYMDVRMGEEGVVLGVVWW